MFIWKPLLYRCLSIVALLAAHTSAQAQDLEPRLWSHIPTGASFIGAGFGYSDGETFVDPALRIENVEYQLSFGSLSYIHSFGLWGKTARLTLSVPYAMGRWQGLLDGELRSVRRRGFMDPKIRFSVNLYGAPALKMPEFRQYRADKTSHTTVGAGVSVLVPLGEYSAERLINLGKNRWTVRPQIGLLHERGKMSYEVTGSVFLHSSNKDFFADSKTLQDPLLYAQTHIVRTFRPGLWASFSAGYAIAGENNVNGEPKGDSHRDFWWGLSLGLPLTPQQGIKLALFRSKTNVSTGSTTNTVIVGWSYMWGR